MKISRKVKICLLAVVLLSVVTFMGLKKTAPIKANEESYSLQVVDTDYKGTGFLKVDLVIPTMHKEILRLTAEGTMPIGDENLFDGVPTEYENKVLVKQPKDLNSVDFDFKENGGKFVTTLLVQVDPDTKLDKGSFSLKNADGQVLTSTSFDVPKVSDAVTSETEVNSNTLVERSLIQAVNYAVSPLSVDVPTPSNPVDVSTWEQFKAAVTDRSVDWINLKADFSATSAGPTATRSKVINGKDGNVTHSIDFLARYVTLGTASPGSFMALLDMNYSGSATPIFRSNTASNSANWELRVNNLATLTGNASSLTSLVNGSVVISGENNFVSTAADSFIASKNLKISDHANVTADLVRGFYTTSISGSSLLVNEGSKVNLKSTGNYNVIQAMNVANFEISGADTELNVVGYATGGASSDGIFLVNSTSSVSNVNILAGAKLAIKSLAPTSGSPAFFMRSLGGKLIVDDNSTLDIEAESADGNNLVAAVRFYDEGNNSFEVSNNSKVNILKKSTNNSGVRMFSNNNSIIVSGGSDFLLKNKGDGTPRNPGANGRNQGIQFRLGSSRETSYFKALGEDSNVLIEADYGAAIDCNSQMLDVEQTEGAYFVVRGKTAGSNYGIFSSPSNTTTFNMTKPKYFDFRNDSSGGGLIFQNGASSTFVLNGSDLSVWKNGQNLDGNPSLSWTVLNASLSGSGFRNIVSTDNPDFQGKFAGADAYSRMTANNQNAVVDELRVPTNADKYIWGHASVPEGKSEENRDAYTDEVHVRVKVYKADGTLDFEQVGSSIGDENGNGGESVYGDAPRAGIIKIQVPEGKFLTQEHTIKVVGAWRGSKSGEGTESVHTSKPDELQAPDRSVLDVTPPEPAKLTDVNLNNATKVLAGDGSEVGATVYVYYDNGDKNTGNLLGTTRVQPDGKWVFNLPAYVDKEKELSIYLEDTAGKQSYDPNGLIKPPVTNTDKGNINPYQDYTYHDAVFKGVAKYEVKDILPDTNKIVKEFTTSGHGNTSVGDTLTYTLNVNNAKSASYATTLRDAWITDQLAEGLKFDPANAEVKINGELATSAQFSYVADTRTLTVKIGDLKSTESAKVTFKVTVQQSAVDQDIKNTAYAHGYSPRETSESFVPGINANPEYDIYDAKSNEVSTGAVFGTLSITSAPTVIDFKTHVAGMKDTRVENPELDKPLVVSDNRGILKQWTLTAALTKEMRNVDDNSKVLSEAVRYNTGTKEFPLTGESLGVLTQTHATAGDYVVSSGWGPGHAGLKLVVPAGNVQKLGQYQGEITWKLGLTP